MWEPSRKTTVSIRGKERRVKGMSEFVTLQYPNDRYIKITFDDDAFLMVVPKDRELYFQEKLSGRIAGIPDGDIGKLKTILYNGKNYRLGTVNDYQFCVRRYVGNQEDLEGECRFSDYFPTDGTKEYLSLGWTTFDGKRSDINCKLIGIAEIDSVEN